MFVCPVFFFFPKPYSRFCIYRPFFDTTSDEYRAENRTIFTLDYLTSRSNISRVWTFALNDPFPRSDVSLRHSSLAIWLHEVMFRIIDIHPRPCTSTSTTLEFRLTAYLALLDYGEYYSRLDVRRNCRKCSDRKRHDDAVARHRGIFSSLQKWCTETRVAAFPRMGRGCTAADNFHSLDNGAG